MVIIARLAIFVFADQRSKNRTSLTAGAARRKTGADSRRKCIGSLAFSSTCARHRSPSLAAGQGAATPADSAEGAGALR
jgi:hypothetical protein